MKRNIKITVSGWIVSAFEIIVLLISMRYLSPETIGSIYFAIAFRELALSSLDLSGIQDYVHLNNDEHDETKLIQIRTNLGGLIFGLIPIFLVASVVLLPLTFSQFSLILIYFIAGLFSYAMSTTWNLTDRGVWHVNAVTQIPSGVAFAFTIWILAHKGFNELDIVCFAYFYIFNF